MIYLERSVLLLICSVVLNCVLTVCLIFTCAGDGREKLTREEKTKPAEAALTLEDYFLDWSAGQQDRLKEILASQIPQAGGFSGNYTGASSGVSYSAQRSGASNALAGIRGRVNTTEINPVNFENPDINILKQMGAQPYLIYFFTGEQFYKEGNYDRALTEYNAAINNYADFSEAYISRANTWLKKSDYARAIDDYSRAIRLNGNKAELYNYRGFARSERQEYVLAIEDFSRAIALNANYVDALVNRSYAYYQSGSFDKAIEDCTRILRLEPNNASIWNRRGSAHYRNQDDDKAIADFTEAIRLRRDYATAWRNRGTAWQSKGEQEKADADFATARQLGR